MNPQPSIHELAFSEPDVSGIAPHVWEAHRQAAASIPHKGKCTAEIFFKPGEDAFELVAESKEFTAKLRALGPGAKITIHFGE